MNTQYGFTWGRVEVIRLLSDKKYGHYLKLTTAKGIFYVRVTPCGNVYANKGKDGYCSASTKVCAPIGD